jgi:hypothetical protein
MRNSLVRELRSPALVTWNVSSALDYNHVMWWSLVTCLISFLLVPRIRESSPLHNFSYNGRSCLQLLHLLLYKAFFCLPQLSLFDYLSLLPLSRFTTYLAIEWKSKGNIWLNPFNISRLRFVPQVLSLIVFGYSQHFSFPQKPVVGQLGTFQHRCHSHIKTL